MELTGGFHLSDVCILQRRSFLTYFRLSKILHYICKILEIIPSKIPQHTCNFHLLFDLLIVTCWRLEVQWFSAKYIWNIFKRCEYVILTNKRVYHRDYDDNYILLMEVNGFHEWPWTCNSIILKLPMLILKTPKSPKA